MSKNRAKAQHYVPRSAYLEHFRSRDQQRPLVRVYGFDNTTGELGEPTSVAPRKLCREYYMYESPEMPVNALEQRLAHVEEGYMKVLSEKILEKQALSEDELQAVSLFLSTMYARGPVPREGINHFIDQVINRISLLEKQFGNGKESQEHREWKNAKHSAFAEYVAIVGSINPFKASSILFLHNETFVDPHNGGYFITSDRPVAEYDFAVMNAIWGVPPLSRTAEFTVPLTPEVLAFVNNSGLAGHDTIDPNFIAEANNRTLTYCRGRIFSPYPVSEAARKRMIARHRQSFLLKFKERR